MITNGTTRRVTRLWGTILALAAIASAASCRRGSVPQLPAPTTAPTTAPATRPAAAPPLASGEAVVRAMRDKYNNKWYRSATFTQKTTTSLSSGGEVVQTWHEAMQLPGKLRIDTDLKSKSGTLFARDSIYSFSSGRMVTADTGVNSLLVLGFDVYAQPSNRTISLLRRLGYNLDLVHESTWQGKPVYVVGAEKGDTVSRQFWVDRDRLLFVRSIERGRQGRIDVRFNQYVESGGGWIAVEVVQLVNGRRRLLEEYSDVRTNVPLGDAQFDPKLWATAPHWTAQPPR